MRKQPRYVSGYTDARGRVRWRLRVPGRPAFRSTTAAFGSVEWWAWYHEGTNDVRPAKRPRGHPDTLEALIVAYYKSTDWAALKASTRVTYRGIIERLREKHGHRLYGELSSGAVKKLMDAQRDTPAAANNLLKILRAIYRFAQARELVSVNPAEGVKPITRRSDGFHTWTDEQIAQFDARWPLGTKERLAKDLFLFTAQRRSDVRTMGPQHIENGRIRVRQEKTGTPLLIPLHPDLATSIAAYPPAQLAYITTRDGAPYSAAGFGNWFAAAVKAAKLPKGVSAHGLRKAAARRLAEAGCTASEIASVTGHKTLKEVERYTRAADQARLAWAAMAKIGGTEKEQSEANRRAVSPGREVK